MRTSLRSLYVLFFFFFSLFVQKTSGQFLFEGELPEVWSGQVISLSLIKDPLRSDRVYADQIILQTEVDDHGRFVFSGEFLPDRKQLYRIHASPCFEEKHSSTLRCRELEERIFVAQKQDSLLFTSNADGGFLCQENSEQVGQGVRAQDLRRALPMGNHAPLSEAARALQFEQWLSEVETFYVESQERLLVLYILGDVANPKNEYHSLVQQMAGSYWNELEPFIDSQMADAVLRSPKEEQSTFPWGVALSGVLLLFLLAIINLWLHKKVQQIPPTKLLDEMSQKEQALLADIVKGMSNKELADTHHISLSTVKTHINNIYRKTGASNRQELIRLFSKPGLPGFPPGV